MILYLVKSTFLLALLLGLYKLLLENEKMHRFKRFYLILSLIIGLSAPLIQYELAPNTTVAGIELDKVDQIVEAPSEFVANSIEPIITPDKAPPEIVNDQFVSEPKSTFPTGIVLLAIYLGVTLLLLLRFGEGLHQIFSSVKKGNSVSMSDATLVLLEESITPQSFLKWIFLNREDYESGKIGEDILEHERAHIRQLHSLDVIFAEILKAFFWFNPFIYWYKQSILLNHEFLADEHVVTNVSATNTYRETLLQFASSETKTSLSNNFNHSTPKRRIIMLYKSYQRNVVFLKQIFTLPAMLAMGLFFSVEIHAQSISESSVLELSEALFQKIESKESLSENEEEALTQLFALFQQVRINVESEKKTEADAVNFLIGEAEKIQIQMRRKVHAYLDFAKPENNPTLEELQKKYDDLSTANTLLATVQNQIRQLQGSLDISPPPPLPPSPEQILERMDQ